MKNVLIAYYSASGKTEKMAEYIAEGVRFSGQKAAAKKIEDIRAPEEIAGYDGYIFGSPTYSLDVPEPMKKFLALAGKAGLAGKPGGAFGSYTHDVGYKHENHAPAIILDSIQNILKMEPFELGPFILRDDLLKETEGMKACQDYGKIFGEKLGS
jgi:flavodoxin